MLQLKHLLLIAAPFFTTAALADGIDEGINIPARSTEKSVLAPDSTLSATDAPETWRLRVKKKLGKFDPTLKFGGYIMGQYTISDQKGIDSNSNFNLRFVRLYANGYVFHDFYYRFQLEVNDAPGVDKGPRVVDAFMEWQKFKFLRVKLGQFKRSWGFENPIAPHAVGLGCYSQIGMNFAIKDRCGEHKASGRDLGLQIQGDLLPIGKDRHHFIHYQVGVFNGQGINHADADNFKDVIAGLWFMPVKDLQIGGFGWNGKYTNESFKSKTKTEADAAAVGQRKSVDRKRWGVGLNYTGHDWVVRAEYQRSFGGVTSDITKSTRNDGWYVTVGAPLFKNFKLYGRWDCYRENCRTWNDLRTDWGVAANYKLCKNLAFQANYYFTDDRSIRGKKDSHYGKFDFQVTAIF